MFGVVFPAAHTSKKIPVMYLSTSKHPQIARLATTMFPGGHAVRTVVRDDHTLYLVHADYGIDAEPNHFMNNLLSADPSVVHGPAIVLGFDPFEAASTPKPPKFPLKRVLDAQWRQFKALQKAKLKQSKQLLRLLRTGVKKARRPYDFFCSEFQTKYRQELRAQDQPVSYKALVRATRAHWSSMPSSDKKPYETLALRDRTRYDTELAAFKAKYPEPPHKPRKAHRIFASTNPNQRWRSADAETKQHCTRLAEMDVQRYKEQRDRFMKWCADATVNAVDACKAWKVKPEILSLEV